MALDIALHKNLLIKILKDIYTDPTLGPYLGFKGGTAAYLFYDLGRFSVDLDFDLLDPAQEDQVFRGIQAILEKYGRLKEVYKKRFNLLYILSYEDKVSPAPNIKVEINRRQFGSRYEIKSYLGIPMKVMIPADMAAHKLVAMIERLGSTNRDIFDVWFFLEHHWPINKDIVEQRTSRSFSDFLQTCIERLEKMSDQNILAGVGELLDTKQKTWAKQHLRSETIFLLKLLYEGEKRF